MGTLLKLIITHLKMAALAGPFSINLFLMPNTRYLVLLFESPFLLAFVTIPL